MPTRSHVVPDLPAARGQAPGNARGTNNQAPALSQNAKEVARRDILLLVVVLLLVMMAGMMCLMLLSVRCCCC